MHYSKIRKNITFIKFEKLVVISVLIGFLSAFLAVSLKTITEHYETILFAKTAQSKVFIFIFPIFGLSVIYFLRQYLFKKKENKGITEIFESTRSKNKILPLYKIPSHFINGLLTVAFGGSTGVEVSTVVASAAIASSAQQKENLFKKHKTELICAGVAAGITALFCSPIAGILFAYEVISKKINKIFLITTGIAVAIAFAFIHVLDEEPLFAVTITDWHYRAIPYFILLGILCGINAVYLTRCTIFIKFKFAKINVHYHKIVIGAAILSVAILFLPQLYGDGYHAIHDIFANSNHSFTVTLAITILAVLIVKPIVTSVTLASGGDGGVFAPSLFLGAFLGFLWAAFLNTFLHANVIPVNFMVIGMAAMLSASIHAPFTALFIACGMTGNYTLFFPILAVCLVSKVTAKMIYPFTVYTYTAAK